IVGTRYDPLMAKLIVHGHDRPEALDRLRSALRQTALRGLTTNVGFLRWLAALPDFERCDARTDSIETHWRPGPVAVPEIYWQAAALELAEDLRNQDPRAGFRLNGPPVLRIRIGADERTIALGTNIEPIANELPGPVAGTISTADGGPSALLDLDGRALEARLASEPTVETAAREASRSTGGAATVTAAMPGTVIAVRVASGDMVAAHHVLMILEAMKMENPVTAPADGRVSGILVRPGQTVQRGAALVEME
ncbi:MAG: biotin/lipoyl-containing protein, partial [Candidatus Limnocylindrales bacterium]